MLRMWQARDSTLMVTLLLDSLYMSTRSVKMRLAAHLLIRASSLPYTIITTRSIRLAKCKIPDFHAYMFIILVRSPSIPIFHCLADIYVFKDPIWDCWIGF